MFESVFLEDEVRSPLLNSLKSEAFILFWLWEKWAVSLTLPADRLAVCMMVPIAAS